MPQEYGIQQFELCVDDSFATHNPNNGSCDVSVNVTIPVTLYWDLKRTKLDERKDVGFASPRWLGAGKGPHPVWDSRLGGKDVKVGTVEWDVITEVLRKTETNPAGSAYRTLVTPYVRLLRTYTPASGGSPTIEEVRTQGSTVQSAWIELTEKA